MEVKKPIQWNSTSVVTNGPKKFGDHINESFFYKKMCGHFAMQPKKNW